MAKIQTIRTIDEMRRSVALARARGTLAGLVPTMGALHAGHAALIRRAREETGYVVVSVFVNPIQFDRGEDFERYRRVLEADVEYCEALRAGAVFAPSRDEVYPSAPLTFVETPALGERLCGAFRPGHFRGVATVVAKLLNIVQPDKAYFGEKDAQQLAIIQRMVDDLNFPVAIVPVPTVREPDGLAMSSRNRHLSAAERAAAPALYGALLAAAAAVRAGGGPEDAKNAARAVLERQPLFRLEYLEVVDPAGMQPLDSITGPARIMAAAWLGGTRLIDNVLCAAD